MSEPHQPSTEPTSPFNTTAGVMCKVYVLILEYAVLAAWEEGEYPRAEN